jgi:hypothetical protein
MEWKEDMVKKIFMPHDSDEFLRIIVPNVDITKMIAFLLKGMLSCRTLLTLWRITMSRYSK